SCGSATFAADHLQFCASKYDGQNAFAAVKWRMAEIRKTGAGSKQRHSQKGLREITAVWESPELSDADQAISIPAGIAKSGHTYRVRARMKDATGRWSHWSAPVEFVAK